MVLVDAVESGAGLLVEVGELVLRAVEYSSQRAGSQISIRSITPITTTSRSSDGVLAQRRRDADPALLVERALVGAGEEDAGVVTRAARRQRRRLRSARPPP